MKDGFGRAVSRILSALDFSKGENHLSQQPIPGTHPACARLGAGRSEVPYLALHPMGFSVPRRLLDERWALTPPFHPYLRFLRNAGGMFSVALSVGTTRAVTSRVYPSLNEPRLRGIAPYGVRTFLPSPLSRTEAILRPSKTVENIAATRGANKRHAEFADFESMA